MQYLLSHQLIENWVSILIIFFSHWSSYYIIDIQNFFPETTEILLMVPTITEDRVVNTDFRLEVG